MITMFIKDVVMILKKSKIGNYECPKQTLN